MKKIFTLLAVAAMAATASAQEPLWLNFLEAGDSNTPFVDPYSGTEVLFASTMTWENGASMILLKEDKAYSGGNTAGALDKQKPIKLSNGAPNLLILPEGFSTDKIEFIGYCNDKNTELTAWISNISIENAGALETVYENVAAPNEDGTPGSSVEKDFLPNVDKETWSSMTLEDMPKIVCNLSKPVSGKIYFRNGGKQPCIFINIYKADEGAVSTVIANENAPVEYFNLQGVRVDNPANGLYIRRQGNEVSKVLVK